MVGECFNNRTGAGITMSNLFRNWPEDRLSVVTEHIVDPELSITNKYYLIGSEEKKRPWPLNYIRVTSKSGFVEISKSANSQYRVLADTEVSLPVKIYLKLNSIIGKILAFFGFYHLIYKFTVSEKLLEYVNQFKPDLIYSHLHYLEFMQFVHKLHLKTKIPLAVHMMDDWLKAVEPNGLFKLIWQNKTEKVFRKVIQDASVLMSICEAMTADYKTKYGFDFIPFHNPVETKIWMTHSKNDWSYKTPFRMLYAGRIGVGTLESVIDIAEAVEELNKNGLEIVLEIQTRSINKIFNEAITQYNCIKINPTLEYAKLPEKFSSVDLLILPMDFDDKSLKYIWLSMPTKVSEYLSTGTPILVYAPQKTALARYALDKEWGIVVSERSQFKLREAIKNIYNDHEMRIKLGKRGKELTVKYHDAEIVRDEFRNQMASVISSKKFINSPLSISTSV